MPDDFRDVGATGVPVVFKQALEKCNQGHRRSFSDAYTPPQKNRPLSVQEAGFFVTEICLSVQFSLFGPVSAHTFAQAMPKIHGSDPAAVLSWALREESSGNSPPIFRLGYTFYILLAGSLFMCVFVMQTGLVYLCQSLTIQGVLPLHPLFSHDCRCRTAGCRIIRTCRFFLVPFLQYVGAFCIFDDHSCHGEISIEKRLPVVCLQSRMLKQNQRGFIVGGEGVSADFGAVAPLNGK